MSTTIDRDDDEDRDADEVVAGRIGEPGRESGQRHLVAAGDEVVDAPEDAERPEGRHDRRHVEHRDEDAVDHAQPEADREAEDDGRPRAKRVRLEGDRNAVGDQPHRRLDREVDVARDDDERLADGGHRGDRGEHRHLAQVVRGQELRRRQGDQGAQHEHDRDETQLALPGDGRDHRPLLGSGRRNGCHDRLSHRPTRDGRCRWPRTSRLPRSPGRGRSRRRGGPRAGRGSGRTSRGPPAGRSR